MSSLKRTYSPNSEKGAELMSLQKNLKNPQLENLKKILYNINVRLSDKKIKCRGYGGSQVSKRSVHC